MSQELDDAIESDRRAQWLFDHKAPLEWVILTRFEIGTIKNELATLRADLLASRRAFEEAVGALRKIDAKIPKHWNGVGDRKVYHEPSPEDPVGGYTDPYFDEIVDDVAAIVEATLRPASTDGRDAPLAATAAKREKDL